VKVRVGKRKKKKGEFFSFPCCVFLIIKKTPRYLFYYPFFPFPCPSFFLSDDRYWSRLFIPQPGKCTSRDFPPDMERRLKEGGREGRPIGPLFSSSLNPTLQNLPLSVFSFGKVSPCSVNLEKKLEGVETG
jgi:hypothetical protein